MERSNVYEKPVTIKNILRFAVPTIAMTVFMSFYTMVDGLFVSNLIGTDALSAINLTAPIIQLVTAISTMRAEIGIGKGGFYFSYPGKCHCRDCYVCGGVYGDGSYFCKYGSLC